MTKKHEVQFLTEAKLTPRSVARFNHVGRQRLSGTPHSPHAAPPLHAAGATVLAHENTKKRMSEPHDQPVLYRGPDGTLHDLHFDASPAEALPQQTFPDSYKLQD